MLKFYLKGADETILAYTKARLLFVDGKNFLSENKYLLIPNLINVSAYKLLCKRLNAFETILNSQWKGFKLGGNLFNNWLKKNIIFVGQSSVLASFVKLFFM